MPLAIFAPLPAVMLPSPFLFLSTLIAATVAAAAIHGLLALVLAQDRYLLLLPHALREFVIARRGRYWKGVGGRCGAPRHEVEPFAYWLQPRAEMP